MIIFMTYDYMILLVINGSNMVQWDGDWTDSRDIPAVNQTCQWTILVSWVFNGNNIELYRHIGAFPIVTYDRQRVMPFLAHFHH